MLQNAEEWTLAIIQCYEIDEVKDARIAQPPEFGIRISATQDNLHIRASGLDRLGNPQCSIQISWEWHRQSDDSGLDRLHVFPADVQHSLIGQGQWPCQRA